MPERPQHRPAPRRSQTFLFWTVFLLFVAGLGYLGLLAFTDTGPLATSVVVESHGLAKLLIALAAVAAVAGGVATRHHMH